MEGEKLIHRAILVFSKGEDDPEVVPWQLVSHARAMRDLGHLDQADEQARRGYVTSLKGGDRGGADQARLLSVSIARLRGNPVEAQKLLAELEPPVRSLPPGDVFPASFLAERALIEQAQGDLSSALNSINQSVSIADASVKSGKKGADLIPLFLTYRSNIERLLGRSADAVTDASQALTQLQQAAQPGTFSCDIGRAYLALGLAQQAQGNKAEESHLALRSASTHLENTLGPDHPDTRNARQLTGLDPAGK